MKRTLFLLAWSGFLASAFSLAGKDASAIKSSASVAGPRISLTPVDDEKIEEQLAQIGAQFVRDGRTTKLSELARQLGREHCDLRVPRAGTRKLSPVELVRHAQAGVLVVAKVYLCAECPRWHVNTASGFMLSESGAFATSYHVVDTPELEAMLILTGDGRVAPVREVLAADRAADVAILRAEGDGFTALPLGERSPAGASVRVISHPDGRYFTLSEGVVSRYFAFREGGEAVTLMAITADFAKGSSGAPVLDERGAVVGMVNNTFSSYYSTDHGRKEDLQMVFKNCTPAESLRKLIRRR